MAPRPARSSPAVWSAILLLALTAFAAALRFTHLERPSLWIDECLTFWRTCGSYGDLLDVLRNDGFVPLHYELLWWIKQGMPLGPGARIVRDGLFQSPRVMRFVPALCGTLMVPVTFFVARQLFDRATALLAAALVSCSAYGLFYSRDAKMYMPAWMLGTLAMGCLLWWLRTGRSTAWLAWVAAGAAAAGVHVVTLLLLALAPIFLLSQRRTHWRQSVFLLAGAALIAAGPAGYYLGFNRWTQRSGGIVPGVNSQTAPDANWHASGLDWIPNVDGSPSTVFPSLSAYLSGFEWDGSIDPRGWEDQPAWLRRSVVAAISTTCGLLILGMLPWPLRWRAGGGCAADYAGQFRPACRAEDWPRKDAKNARKAETIKSVPFASLAFFRGHFFALVSATFEATFRKGIRRRVRHGAPAGGGAAARAIEGAPEPAWRSAFWLACWIILPAYGFLYCRSFENGASPGDWITAAASWWGDGRWRWLIGASIVLAAAGSIFPPARIVLGAFVALVATSLVVLFASGLVSDVTLSPRASDCLAWIMLITVPAALWVYCGSTSLERLRTTLQFAAAAAVILLLCAAAHSGWDALRVQSRTRHPELEWRSIWEPRYMGIVWPAIWIAAAALLMRLPTLPVRLVAIAAIILPNLANGIARFTVPTQPPFDRIFADVWASKPGAGVRTYFDLNGRFLSAGGFPSAVYQRPEAAYAACAAGRLATTPDEFLTGKLWPFQYGPVLERFKAPLACRLDVSPGSIADDLKASPQVGRVIEWNVEQTFQPQTADFQTALGADWRVAVDETINTRSYWTWAGRGSFHHREFVRVAPPATQP